MMNHAQTRLRHVVTGLEGGRETLDTLIALTRRIKADPHHFYRLQPLAHRVLTALFISPSLRTRTSFEAGMARLGGHMVTLTPGGGSWGLAFERGVVMTGAEAEHIREAAGVLSSYSDVIGLRTFGKMQDFDRDMRDSSIRALAEHARVPVISLESSCYHPCQGFADAVTLSEHFDGALQGVPLALTWAPHPKCCGVAVPHSALLTAARLGMDVRLAHPDGYDLHAPIVERAQQLSEAAGGRVRVTHDQRAALEGARVVYAKAWGARMDYGGDAGVRNMRHQDWCVGTEHMALGDEAVLMHCLPVRRNVVVTDAVLDSPASLVQHQAANRMWAQMALLLHLLDAAD